MNIIETNFNVNIKTHHFWHPRRKRTVYLFMYFHFTINIAIQSPPGTPESNKT